LKSNTVFTYDAFKGCKSITSVTLPANSSFVSIFPNNLVNFYESQGKKAGTYTWTGRIWTIGTKQ